MTKRTAYIGLAGPFGYDYTDYFDAGTRVVERPIIENQLGLIVFYEEILFLSKSLCPPELHGLPYIKFADEDPQYSKSIEAAIEHVDYNLFSDIDISMDFKIFASVTDHIIGDSGLGNRIDNHSKYLAMPSNFRYANSMDPRCIIADMYIGHALNISPYDIIFSSAAIDFLERTHKAEEQEEIALAYLHANSSRQITDSLAAIRIPNRYSPDGCYHPSMEALRDIPHLKEYREMLESQDLLNTDADQLAKELSSNASRIVLKATDYYTTNSHLFTTKAQPVVDIVTSTVTPQPISAFISSFRASRDYFQNKANRPPGYARFIAEMSDPRIRPE